MLQEISAGGLKIVGNHLGPTLGMHIPQKTFEGLNSYRRNGKNLRTLQFLGGMVGMCSEYQVHI